MNHLESHNASHQRPYGRIAGIWADCMCLLSGICDIFFTANLSCNTNRPLEWWPKARASANNLNGNTRCYFKHLALKLVEIN